MYVQTNISSLFAQNKLASTQLSMGRTFERLSSGFRINSAADDAAGLGISESMNAQVRSYFVAERNANDGISMAQVADGAAGQIGNMLARLRELAVQSANGALTTVDRENLQTEFSEIQQEIDRMTTVAKFNGLTLLDGSLTSGVTFQVSINNASSEQVTVMAFASALNGSALGIDSAAANVLSTAAATSAITSIDSAIQALNTTRESFGAAMNRLQAAIQGIQSARTNLAAALGRIRDVDVAEESANMTKWQVLSQAGASVLAQANQAPQVALSLLKG
jgi:flagellin